MNSTTVIPLDVLLEEAGVDALIVSIRGQLAQRHRIAMSATFILAREYDKDHTVGIFTLEHRDSRISEQMSDTMFMLKVYSAPKRLELWRLDNSMTQIRELLGEDAENADLENEPSTLIGTAGYATLMEQAVHVSMANLLASALTGAPQEVEAKDPKRFDYRWGHVVRAPQNLEDMSPLLSSYKKKGPLPASETARSFVVNREIERFFEAAPYGASSSLVTAVRAVQGDPTCWVVYFEDRDPVAQYSPDPKAPNHPQPGFRLSFDQLGKVVTIMGKHFFQ